MTTVSYINHNLRGPEDINDMLSEPHAEKEPFNYPMEANLEVEPEVDISALKKD